ncbi:hypothetical protein, partial [Pseudomonas aeruginosa]
MSADPRQRLVVAHSVDPAAAELQLLDFRQPAR